MRTFFQMVKRNIKIFFKDKGVLFTSLITPIILLVLYATFLAKVYKSSFMSSLPEGFEVSEKLINGMVSGELFSSLLAVSCVTVAFCANMIMVTDKVTGARKDMLVSPVKKSVLAGSYYVGTLATTIIVSLVAMVASLIYVAITGWFLNFGDCMLLLVDIILLTMFGTALSSLINMFLHSQGQISAVGTIVSAGYGFICGAYMPISQFSDGLQKVIMFLPGTYGTSLLRNHALRGVFAEMSNSNFPSEVVEAVKDSVDCNLYFFDTKVSIGAMYAVLTISVAVIIGAYILLNGLNKKRV